MGSGALKSERGELWAGSMSAFRFSPLIALAAGAISAFAFQPVGFWPLMPAAFAALCELLMRTQSLRRALLIGWLFGLGQFVIGLNWIATAFTYQAAMPAWLGWIAVVLLSLYLAVYPMLAAALAWRSAANEARAGPRARRRRGRLPSGSAPAMFTGFAWNPVGVTFDDTHLLNATAPIGTYGLSALVVLSAA